MSSALPADDIHVSTRHSGLAWRLSLWWTILRTALEERLVYRGDFALGTLMRFPADHHADLFCGTPSSIRLAKRKVRMPRQIGGFGFREIVAYYLLTMIARAFSSMPGLASGIARQIRDGEIKRYLIQPVDLIGFLLLSRIAHKLAYYAVAIAPFALVFFLCRQLFRFGLATGARDDRFHWVAGDGLSDWVLLEAAIGMIGFWFLEVSSLLFVYMLFSFFLSGHMFPLTLAPRRYRRLCELLAVQVPRLFSGRRFSWESSGRGPADGNGDRSRLARVLHHRMPCCVRPRRESLQRLWGLTR